VSALARHAGNQHPTVVRYCEEIFFFMGV